MSNTKVLVSEICAEQGITCLSLSKGYILRLTKNGLTRHIYGNYWDLNSAAADRLACDKAGCFTLLKTSGVPAIEHTLVYNPIHRGAWAEEEGTLQYALTYLEKHNNRIVVKPNQGTQGRDVYYCDAPIEVERALITIFNTEPDATLSPYAEIGKTYGFKPEYAPGHWYLGLCAVICAAQTLKMAGAYRGFHGLGAWDIRLD